MKLTYDFHTHTKYSHGTGTILDNAVAAKKKGLLGIAISDHGFSHPAFGMRHVKVAEMKRECIEAEKQTGIKVKLGIESNILGDCGKTDVTERDYEALDVFLAGIHRFVLYHSPHDLGRLLVGNIFDQVTKIKPSKSLIDYNTRVYCNAVKNNPIDVITHLNYLVYADPVEVAKCCADYGTYLEINTKKLHLTPEEWDKIFQTKVNFVIDSDAHSPDRIGDLALFKTQMRDVDFPLDRIHNLNGKVPKLRFEEFKKHL